MIKEITFLTTGMSLITTVYAGNVELIVKYKENKTINSGRELNYGVITEIDSRTKVVVVDDKSSDLNAFGDRSSSKINEYTVARNFMDNNPNVEYAIPKNSKMYANQLVNKSTQDDSVLNETAQTVNTMRAFSEKQWDMKSPMKIKGGIDAEGAWGLISDENKRIDVAVLDSGLANLTPNDLMKKIDSDNKYYYFYMSNNHIVASDNIVDKGKFHGTHVAGTVAANGPEVVGVAGPIAGIKILPIRVLGDSGGGNTYAILDAVKWAVGAPISAKDVKTGKYIDKSIAPVKVVNLSFGLSRFNKLGQPIVNENIWEKDYMGTLCPAWKDAIDIAHKNGATVVIAAGNDGHNLFHDIPSGCKDIDAIVVESSGPEAELAPYSTYHDVSKWKVNSLVVRAPGGNLNNPTVSNGRIYSTMSRYGYMQGTSMAAPHVAGIAALAYSVMDNSSYIDAEMLIEAALKNSNDINSPDIVNSKNALEYVINYSKPSKSSKKAA